MTLFSFHPTHNPRSYLVREFKREQREREARVVMKIDPYVPRGQQVVKRPRRSDVSLARWRKALEIHILLASYAIAGVIGAIVAKPELLEPIASHVPLLAVIWLILWIVLAWKSE